MTLTLQPKSGAPLVIENIFSFSKNEDIKEEPIYDSDGKTVLYTITTITVRIAPKEATT